MFSQGRRCLVADLQCTLPGATMSVPVRVATIHLESIRFNKAVRAKQLATILPRLRTDPFGAGAGEGKSCPKSGANGSAGTRAMQPALMLLCGDFNLCSTWPEENDLIAADPSISDAWPATHQPRYMPATLPCIPRCSHACLPTAGACGPNRPLRSAVHAHGWGCPGATTCFSVWGSNSEP